MWCNVNFGPVFFAFSLPRGESVDSQENVSSFYLLIVPAVPSKRFLCAKLEGIKKKQTKKNKKKNKTKKKQKTKTQQCWVKQQKFYQLFPCSAGIC